MMDSGLDISVSLHIIIYVELKRNLNADKNIRNR